MPATLLPLGTANNIAASLDLLADLDELVAGWTTGERRRYDLGTVTLGDGEACFVEGVGGGVLAEAIARAGASASESTDEIELGLRTLGHVLATAEPRRWRLRLDGIEESRDLLAVEALVIAPAGPGIPLAPAADVGDAMLDVVFVGESEREELANYVAGRLASGSPPPPRLPIRRARDLRLAGPAEAHLRVDDEPLENDGSLAASTGMLPVEILIPAL